jgi:Tol biopolymer transport system component
LIVFERALPDGTPAAWLIDADGSQPPRLLMENAEQPKFATSGDTIVFSRGPGAIFSMPVDGTSVEALEGVPETAGFIDPEPAMNASGDIAFVLADEGPSGHLWLYRAGSGRFERLTRDSGSLSGRWVQAPAWHPDGHLIFFVAASGDGFDFHLWQANIETGETVQISSGVAGYSSPTLSGDGRHLAYSFSRPLWELVASDPDTGEEESLLRRREPIILPLVSPDGSRVVFFDEQVFSFSIEDDSLRQWTFGDARVALPIWSRSDQSIYYFRDRALHRIDPATAATEGVLDDFHWSKANWLAVHGNRLAFRERTSLVGGRQTVVLDLENGQRRILDAALIPMDWTRDGATLLGVRGNDLVLMTCDAPRFDCMPIVHRGEPVAGARPRWTADERGIFLRRARQDLPGHAWIWRVDRDGGRLERKVQIGPYDPEAMTFGVTRDDRIVWNRYDSQAGSEIWTTTIPDSDAD